MSDYAVVSGGSLKFKGGDSNKKKKKKSHSSSERRDADSSIAESSRAREKENEAEERRKRDRELAEASRRNRDGEREAEEDDEVPRRATTTTGGRQMTDAEKKFEAIQRQRRVERVQKTAKMSHKDRVTEFNNKLDKLTPKAPRTRAYTSSLPGRDRKAGPIEDKLVESSNGGRSFQGEGDTGRIACLEGKSDHLGSDDRKDVIGRAVRNHPKPGPSRVLSKGRGPRSMEEEDSQTTDSGDNASSISSLALSPAP